MKLLKWIFVVLLAVWGATGFWLGLGVGTYETSNVPVEEIEKPVEEVEEPTSGGERGNNVYTVEIWDNGEVVVRTGQQYINQLSEHTFLITDRTFDEVQDEIWEIQDLPEEMRYDNSE